MLANLPNYLRPKIPYTNPLTQQRAQGLIIYLAISFVVSVMASIFLIYENFLTADTSLAEINPAEIPGILSPLFVIIFYWAVRNGYYRVSALGVVTLALISLTTFWGSELNSVAVVAFAIPIVTAGLLLGWRTTIAVFLIVAAIASGPLLISDTKPDEFLILILILLIINAFVIIFGSNVQLTASRVIDNLDRLQGVVDMTIKTTTESNENQAAVNTINIIRDQLGYTFARVYLVESEEVVQRIQTGLNLTQINIDTDIQFGGRSGIYEAIQKREVVIIRENDDPLIRQHLLSGTNAALAVPVMASNGEVIAVLDIQSEDLSNYAPDEIRTVELVAVQLGQTIERSRTIDNLRRDLLEQDELITRQRNRLLQYERAERQTTTDTWREYLEQQGVDYLGYDMLDLMSEPVEATTLSGEIQSAITAGDIMVQQDGNQQVVSIPIQLREQTLGAMSFRVPAGSQVVGARQQELIRNVVQRLSLALENKRLFEQSQSQAQRESKANEVGNLLLSSTDINTVLQLAAHNFNEALGAIQTQIRLTPEAQEIGEGEGLS